MPLSRYSDRSSARSLSRRTLEIFAAAALIGALGIQPAVAARAAGAKSKGPSMSKAAPATKQKSPVSVTVLDNGLKVLIQEVHTAPVASFMVWYRVGSRNETSGQTGISHLLEHMMFKGTPTYGKGEIARILQKNGASFNAGTSLDYTNYYEVLAADRLELAMKIESDRMANALIPDEEHRLEMTVVRSELERNEDNPHRALYLETFAQAFKAHPYHWPTIGWRTDVEQIRAEQIRAYYKSHYLPNNATVVIVGDVDKDKALAMVQRFFGPIPRGADPPPVTTVEPPQFGERRFKIRKPGDTSYLMVSWRSPALTDPDTYALDLLGMILGHGKTSRLHQALVEGKLATEVDASNETGRDPFLFIAQATVATDTTLEAVEKALLEEVERLKNEPVTEAELNRAKKQLQASFVYSKDSIRSLAQQLGYYETVATHEYLDTFLDEVSKVKAEDVLRVARTYLTEDSRTVGHYDPIASEQAVGQAETGGGSEANAFEAPFRPALPLESHYREPEAAGAGAASVAASSATATAARPMRIELPNGLVLILKESHANPTVAITGLVKAGAIYDPPGKNGLAGFVARMLDRGTKTRTALQIAESVENVGASLDFDGGSETTLFSGNTLSADLGVLLGSLADVLRNSVFPDDQAEKARGELITEVKISDQNTGRVAARTANELLFPEGHPFHLPPMGSEAPLSSITRQDLAAFHAAHYGPNTTTLVLVGDVDPRATVDLVNKVFGDWKRIEKPAPFAVPAAKAPSAIERKVVFMRGKSQTDVVYGVPGIERTAPDYYAANIMNYILGGGSLSSRLMDEIRDKRGLVYSIYSNFTPGIGAGPMQIRAGTNPANMDSAVSGLLAQVKRMHDDGPTAEELADAKSYLTGVFPVRLEANSGVAATLLTAETYGLGMDFIERYASIIGGISLEDTRAAAKKYLNPDAYVLVIAGSYGQGEPGGKGQ